MNNYYAIGRYLFIFLILLIGPTSMRAQSTAFSYQGRLTDNMAVANGMYQMQFALFDSPTAGTQIGTTIENSAVAAVNGIFTIQLDFGTAPFTAGAERYLEVRVRRNSNESYTTLAPRHPIGRVPYATNSLAGEDERGRMLGALRWDLLRTRTSYPITAPRGIAFDGTNIWVTTASGNVLKIRPTDGTVLGTYPVGSDPRGIASDGTNVWIANFGSNTVTRLRASDGSPQGTFAAGTNPIAICFDGTNIWVVNNGSANVSWLRASDGQLLQTFSAPQSPTTIVFDGAEIWIGSASVIMRRRISNVFFVSTVAANGSVIGYDGYHHWVPVGNNFDIYRLRSSDGFIVEAMYVTGAASTMTFDGKALWVGLSNSPTALRINVSAPRDLLATLPVALPFPSTASVFDGKNVWFLHAAGNSITKLPAYP